MKQLNWYQIFGKSNIPDGRTVLPTDDIQIWLNCADIWDKTYTTLAEVLADTDTLSALIASENAVDYMVRSTTWAVAQALVPTMTSNTTPSGVCTASARLNPTYQPYLVFDGNDSTFCALYLTANVISGSSDYWIQYESENGDAVVSAIFKYLNTYNGFSSTITKVKVAGSNDGETFTDLVTQNISSTNTEFPIPNISNYKYLRFYVVDGSVNSYINIGFMLTTLQFYSASITDSATAMSYIGLNNYCANTLLADSTWCEAICNSEYFESVLNVKVPIMTSATTPSGEVIDSGSVNSNYVGYRAFNGVVSTFYGNRWVSIQYSSSAQVNGQYLGYIFPDSVLVSMLTIQQQTIESYTYDTMIDTTVAVQYSDDNISWTTVKNISLTSATAKQAVKHIVNNVTSHRYHRLLFNNANMRDTQINKYCAVIAELQFYGREDV